MDNPLDSKEEDGGGSLRRLLECHATTTTSNSSNGVDNIETGRIAQTNPFPLPPPDIPQPPVQHPLQPTKPDGIAHWVAKPLDLSLLSASSSIVSRQSSVNTTPRQANRRAASIPQDVTTGARPTTGSTNITHTSSGTSGLLLLTAPSSRSALVTGSGINSIGGTKKKLEDSRDGNAAKLAGNNRKINPKLKQSIIASRTSTTTAAVAGRISSSSAIVRLPTPHPPSHCSLLCCFYAEFDNTVGPKILYQSPHHFMEQDIRSTTVQHMEGLLHKAFYPKATNSNNKPDESATRSSPHTNEHATLEQRSATPKHEKGDDEVDDDDAGAEDATNTTTPLTIFDSCSEYIITGNELTGNIINLSTHHIHVLTRPTTIADEKYERNSLLFCVGFILRRTEDPRPFRPVLSTLALTLREMEVESQFLSRNRSEIQGILESILISLNSQSSECNLLLGKADMLNLKLFLPPKPLARSVKDHDVPILLRRDWQAQSYDRDQSINWVSLHIDGIANARQISKIAEVDLEIVRACLRVLKHHNVISLVDMFCYSNRYECTERIRLDSKLLHESVDYVIKRRNPQHPSSKTSPGCETDSPTRRGLGPMSPSHRPDISQCHTLSSSVQTDYSLRENSYPRMASGGSYGREVPLTDLLKPAEIEEIKMAVADFIYGCGRHTTIGEHWISLISTVTTKAPVTPHGGVDWKKMFDIIDHRRLITFGVVHGTIRRVHNFPQLVGMSKANECYMTTDDAPAHTMLDDRSRQQHIVRYEQQQQKTALVNKAASLLNGLRCDDELVCSLELPLSAILAFFPEESVISVYATD